MTLKYLIFGALLHLLNFLNINNFLSFEQDWEQSQVKWTPFLGPLQKYKRFTHIKPPATPQTVQHQVLLEMIHRN